MSILHLSFVGRDEETNIRDAAVEAGGLLHPLRQRVQGGLRLLTLAPVTEVALQNRDRRQADEET